VLEAAPTQEAATVAATTNDTPWTESGFNSVWDRFKDKLEEDGKIGSHLTIHGLRHTLGEMLAESEASLDAIRRTLGQKTLAMAQHYSERAKKRSAVRRAVEKMVPLGTRECPTWLRRKLTFSYLKEISGAQGRNRTTDTAIFSRMLYQLSYLGV
jgi:hypothetical protein